MLSWVRSQSPPVPVAAPAPDLRVYIDAFIVGEGGRPEDTSILMVANVRNLGNAPTVVDGFVVSLIFPKGEVVRGNLITIPDSVAVYYLGYSEMIYGEDALNRKTVINPILPGALVRGRLMVEFSHLGPEAVKAPGVELQLSIRDAWEKIYSTKVDLRGGERVGLQDFPGLRPARPAPKPDTVESQPQ